MQARTVTKPLLHRLMVCNIMLRITLATIGFAALAVVSAPYVLAAASTESSPSVGEQRCRGTIGEARVHCVETLKMWEA